VMHFGAMRGVPARIEAGRHVNPSTVDNLVDRQLSGRFLTLFRRTLS